MLLASPVFCLILLLANAGITTGRFWMDSGQKEADEDSLENQNLIIAIILKDNRFLRSNVNENAIVKPVSIISRPELKMTSNSDTDEGNDENGSKEFDGIQLTSQQKNMLRKKWRASCDKKASKVCKKACMTALKSVCHSYRCKKSLKKSFKKECKRSCQINFLGKDVKSDSD